MSRELDVLVVGTGTTALAMAGVLLARQLVRPGRVAVIGRRVPSAAVAPGDWGPRVYALSRASQRLLDLCGTWQALPPDRLSAYERMCVWDARGEPGGAGSLTFDCAEMGEPNLGFIVDGDTLLSQSFKAAQSAGVEFIDAALDAIVTGDADVRVRLDDGRELRAQLLIAADGTQSKARELLGIDTAGHAYHQDALVAHVRTAKPHRNTAWQRFLTTGPLALLPLPDGRSSIVWSTSRAEAARLAALDPVEFGYALTAASGAVLGECELATPLASFPLKLQVALGYVRSRAVLLGDAAHVIHPLAGQGLNLGLLDCAALADVLGAAGKRGLFGEQRLLRRYERWRRSENLLTAGALDGLERLFSSDNPLLSRLRRSGLDAVGAVPAVKRQLALRAMGLGGDVPSWLATRSG
jgi:2-octaprenylphenol hydroxylase